MTQIGSQAVVECDRTQLTELSKPVRMLIVFNTVCLYGMELSVIESFDCLRPHVLPLFLLPRATQRHDSAILKEIQRRGLPYALFSDHFDWPRIGRPRSWKDAILILFAIIRANIDVLREARGQDVVYIPISTGLYFSALTALRLRIQGKRVIYSFHELALKRSNLLRIAMIWISDIVHMTTLSDELTVRWNPFLARKRNHVIPPVVDVHSRTVDRRPDVHGYAGRCNLLFMGQVSKHKGIDILLEAFQGIAAKYDDVMLHIVGGSAWEYQGDFPAAIARTGVADRIRYWGYCADVQQFLEIAYVYVHPSPPSVVHESFGRGAVEAMSMGVPTVCFRSGALAEIVEHETTGLFCEKEDAQCLASNLERLLADRALRDRLGRQARERFEACYSSERIREQWLQFFDRQ